MDSREGSLHTCPLPQKGSQRSAGTVELGGLQCLQQDGCCGAWTRVMWLRICLLITTRLFTTRYRISEGRLNTAVWVGNPTKPERSISETFTRVHLSSGMFCADSCLFVEDWAAFTLMSPNEFKWMFTRRGTKMTWLDKMAADGGCCIKGKQKVWSSVNKRMERTWQTRGVNPYRPWQTQARYEPNETAGSPFSSQPPICPHRQSHLSPQPHEVPLKTFINNQKNLNDNKTWIFS